MHCLLFHRRRPPLIGGQPALELDQREFRNDNLAIGQVVVLKSGRCFPLHPAWSPRDTGPN